MATANRSPAATFQTHTRECQALLGVVADLVAAQAQTADAAVHWGHVGSMQDLRERLVNLLMPWYCEADGSEAEARVRIEAALQAKLG